MVWVFHIGDQNPRNLAGGINTHLWKFLGVPQSVEYKIGLGSIIEWPGQRSKGDRTSLLLRYRLISPAP